jgi:hypothetical protein
MAFALLSLAASAAFIESGTVAPLDDKNLQTENLLRGMACYLCEFLTDGDRGHDTDFPELSQTGSFEMTLPRQEKIQQLFAFCVPYEEDHFLTIIATDESGLETRMSVPPSQLGDIGKVTKITVPMGREVRNLRIESNAMLTEIEAYNDEPSPSSSNALAIGDAAPLSNPNTSQHLWTFFGFSFSGMLNLVFAFMFIMFFLSSESAVRRTWLARYAHVDAQARGFVKMDGPPSALPAPLTVGASEKDRCAEGKDKDQHPDLEKEEVPQLIPPPREAGLRAARCYLPRRTLPLCMPKVLAGPRGQQCVKVLFASPLVRTTSGDVIAVPRLDVEAEVKSLSRLVLEAKCPVGLEPCVATVENLRRTLLDSRSTCLHIAAHGERGGLVLEDGVGRAHVFGAATLRNLLDSHAPQRVQLVFLNACNSFEIGHAFFNAGAASVICTKQGCTVRDEDAKYFMNTFYAALFSGRTIQAAFGIAQSALSARPSAGDVFLLLARASASAPFFGPAASSSDVYLGPSDGDEAGPSSCSDPEYVVPRVERMREKSTSNSVQTRLQHTASSRRNSNVNVPRLPAPSGDFIARELDIWAIVTHLLKRRLVVLCGAQGTRSGVGKTAVAEEVARWSNVRKSFASIYFLDMQGRYTVDGSEQAWSGVHAVVRGTGRARLLSTGSAFSACQQELSRQGSALLVLDQADALLRNADFQRDVQEILATIPKLHILLVSQDPVSWSGRYKAVHYGLRKLSDADTTELFLRRIGRSITTADIGMLNGGVASPLDKARAHAALLNHPIQALLDGHPRDVTELAAKVTAKLPSILDLCTLDTSRTRLSRGESDRSPMTNWSSDLETARHM